MIRAQSRSVPALLLAVALAASALVSAAPITVAFDADASPSPLAGELRQWAVAVTASTQFASTGFSAQQATGAPDATMGADDDHAWAPLTEDGGDEWLDLRYEHSVVPRGVTVVESFNPGFVTRLEAYDTAHGVWVTLWEGREPTSGIGDGTFTPPLAPITYAIDRIRVSMDTAVLHWNEVDAVELVGTPPG